MSTSKRFKQLKKRINELERRFLGKNKNAPQIFTKRKQDFFRAYRLLVHAEIEHYFEERAEEVINESLDNFMKGGMNSKPLIAVMCNHIVSMEKINKSTKNRINYVCAKYKYYIQRENHGVKSDNIKNTLLPIGIEEEELDQTWLNTLEGFGTDRGEVAHTSALVQPLIDPSTELNTVRLILSGIEDLDKVISNLK